MTMTKINLSIVAILALLLAVSCSSKPDPKLQEAFGVHEQAITVAGEVVGMLDEADNLMASIQAKMAAMPDTANPEEAMKLGAAMTQLQSFRATYEKWDEALVEVPGIKHDHSHDHHDHAHKPIPDHIKNMKPEEIMGLQQNFLVEIEGLKGALEMAIKDAKSLL